MTNDILIYELWQKIASIINVPDNLISTDTANHLPVAGFKFDLLPKNRRKQIRI